MESKGRAPAIFGHYSSQQYEQQFIVNIHETVHRYFNNGDDSNVPRTPLMFHSLFSCDGRSQ
jgi:hypothetical protein